jgi:hypothetical protein|tara:strand:+ start:23164 stop:23358 length:195 start_codon:yes stop_codon:yes gene_type:complete
MEETMRTIEELKKEVESLQNRKEDARVLYIKCEGGIETLQYMINDLEKEDSEKTDKKVGKNSDK